MSDRPHDANFSSDLVAADLAELLRSAAEQTWPATGQMLEGPKSFRMAAGLDPIQLGSVEFRLLLYLAGRPYYPFTRRSIAEAISTKLEPVTADDVDSHVVTLRDQLGVFHDYVQTVPYVGYRFKE